MTAVRILNLFALTALATLLTTLAPQPVQALGTHGTQFGRRHQHAHLAENQLIKKRANSKKCRARPTSSSSASASPSPAPTSTHKGAPAPAPTSTKSPKPSPQPTPSPPSGGGGNNGGHFSKKLGLAWADGSASYLEQFKGKVGWMYNWNADAPSNIDKVDFPYLPQAWGWRNGADFLKVAKNSDAPFFLTINEPNEGGQANMDVGAGVSFWNQYVKPIQNMGKKVTSPATSSNLNGLVWVKQFKQQCNCDWEYTAIHWYDTTFEKFQKYCNDWHDAFGKDIIITEFALQNFNGGGQPSLDEVYAFFSQAIPWLESTPWIIGYAPFGFMAPPTGIQPNMNLLNGGGSLTGLGSFIVGKA